MYIVDIYSTGPYVHQWCSYILYMMRLSIPRPPGNGPFSVGNLCLICAILIGPIFSGTYSWHKTKPACITPSGWKWCHFDCKEGDTPSVNVAAALTCVTLSRLYIVYELLWKPQVSYILENVWRFRSSVMLCFTDW